jgi:enamine deaminase RidA (YjgF/YER057c/UK114 family)
MRTLGVLALACALVTSSLVFGKKKKSEEEETQTLQIPKDPPNAVVADTRRLSFYVSPLSARGLLSHQAREALKALFRSAGNAQIVKIRAFVAGTGDLRRVREIVSESFTERKQPIPAVTVVLAGGLPMEGAQVVLEAVAVARKDVYPEGLVFISPSPVFSAGPLDPISPLAEQTLSKLRDAVKAAGSEPADVMRATCFLSSLENVNTVRSAVEREYPQAAIAIVQPQRVAARAVAACEAVARLRWNTGTPLHLIAAKDPHGMSDAALVRAPRLAITGTQISFGFQDADAKLAFQRLEKALMAVGASSKEVAVANFYPLSASLAAQAGSIRFEFLDRERPPAGTVLPFEGLPSMDAGFGVEVIAIMNK